MRRHRARWWGARSVGGRWEPGNNSSGQRKSLDRAARNRFCRGKPPAGQPVDADGLRRPPATEFPPPRAKRHLVRHRRLANGRRRDRAGLPVGARGAIVDQEPGAGVAPRTAAADRAYTQALRTVNPSGHNLSARASKGARVVGRRQGHPPVACADIEFDCRSPPVGARDRIERPFIGHP